MEVTPPSALPDVRAFLARYEDATRPDSADLGALFEPSFVAGNPRGSFVLTREALVTGTAAKRREMRALHPTPARLTGVQTTWLGELYCLAQTTWELGFAPPSRPPVTLQAFSDFVLQNTDGALTIVTYLARQDIDEEIRRALG